MLHLALSQEVDVVLSVNRAELVRLDHLHVLDVFASQDLVSCLIVILGPLHFFLIEFTTVPPYLLLLNVGLFKPDIVCSLMGDPLILGSRVDLI